MKTIKIQLLLNTNLIIYNTQKAYQMLIKAESEDKMLYDKHVKIDAKSSPKTKIPPAPIICLRTHNKIVVEPRHFEPLDDTKACWYRIFASQSTSVNSKARISDYSFPGCGEQVNITSIQFKIESNS